MKKACVIGYPIAHSRSPIIHNHWLKHYGLDGLYEKREVKPEALAYFLTNLKVEGYVGCNVTIPHKEAAIASVAHIDEIVRKTGSLNTVYFEDGELCATSTDGEGFYRNVQAAFPDIQLAGKKAIVLGAGGAARAIIERLIRAGAEVRILNRTPARAQELASLFGSQAKAINLDRFVTESSNTALLVNTTSQGMKGQSGPELELSALPKTAVVADIVYVPLKTNFLKQAEVHGLRTIGGLGMLLHQAVVGFEKWFGVRPEVTPELYQMVANDVARG